MQEIQGKAKTIRELLKGVKYSIDYYQREYKCRDKQIRELIEDLTGKFLDDYQEGQSRTKVAQYGHYFLGSIIISRKDNDFFIVRPIYSGPAYRQGLKSGDKILEVDGWETAGHASEEIISRLKGRPETPVVCRKVAWMRPVSGAMASRRTSV